MARHPNGRLDGSAWNPYRFQGIPTYFTNLPTSGSRIDRFYGENWSKGASTPLGYGPGGATILPVTAGQIAGRIQDLVLTNSGLNVQEGRGIDGSVTLTFTVGNADLQLIALLVGASTLTLTVSGANLGAAIGIQGSTTMSLTPNTPILGALAGLFGSATVTIDPSGTLTATGNLSGDITPYTELSPENLAAKVWQSISASYTTPGTMGAALNTAGSGGLSPEQSAQLAATLTLPQFVALK